METEFYEVTQGTINRMTGGSTGGMGGPAADPFAVLGGGGVAVEMIPALR